MKILQYILNILAVTLLVSIVYYYGFQKAYITESDYESIQKTSDEIKELVHSSRLNLLKKYDFAQRQSKACGTDKAKAIYSSLKAARVLSVNALVKNKTLVEGGNKLEESTLKSLSETMKDYTAQLNKLGLTASFEPPVPIYLKEANRAVELETYQNTSPEMWSLVSQLNNATIYEMENLCFANVMDVLSCMRIGNGIKVISVPDQEVVAKDEVFNTKLFLSNSQYYIPQIDVRFMEQAASIEYTDNSVAKIVIKPEAGVGEKEWKAKITIMGIDDYKTFDISEKFTVN